MGEERLAGLVQPDGRSCGAAVLVAADLLARPAEGRRDDAEWFRTEVLAMHRRITSNTGADGRRQVPWPRAVGTPPWAIARHLSAVTGSRHAWRPVLDRERAFDQVLAAARHGTAVLYVGNAWLPRHVVLVTRADGRDAVRCYDPARGAVATVTRRAFTSARLGLSRWDRPWFTVLPG